MDFEELEVNVKKTIDRFSLISPADKVIVAVSGGKDSTVLLYVLNKLGYNVTGVTIDPGIPGYSDINLKNLAKFCSEQSIPLIIKSFREEFGFTLAEAMEVVKHMGLQLKACAVCGVFKRTLLNRSARQLNADVIATGHNMDDEAHAFLMNLLKGNIKDSARMGPETGLVKDNRFIKRVKPLYFIREHNIRDYSQRKAFPVYYNECPLASSSFRYSIRSALRVVEDPDTVPNIVHHLLEILPLLRGYYFTEEKPLVCEECGEPSQNRLCQACTFLHTITKHLKEKNLSSQ